ncbi:hypothetical protein [Streptomyces anulatus]|uniref:hypothetical protein n=1 Tax=Streptomyces anulatus TaxID=1892 RepID=UPI003246181D
MIVVFTPAGGEPEQYDARSLLASEASIVARTVDKTWPEVKAGLADEDLDSMRGVVWVLKKRHNATLRFGEFDPGVEELVTRYDKDEVETWVDGAFSLQAADPDLTPERIVQALADVPDAAADSEHATAYIEKCRVEAGKDLEPEPQAETSAPARKSSSRKTSPTSGPSS